MKRFHVLAERPDFPDDWIIINAHRPMWGTKEWRGPYINGVWYAAIAPDEPYLLDMLTHNERDDGRQLIYHTKEELRAIGWEWGEKYYPDNDLDPMDPWWIEKGMSILNEDIV